MRSGGRCGDFPGRGVEVLGLLRPSMPEQQDKELSFDQASGLAQLMLSSAQLPAVSWPPADFLSACCPLKYAVSIL